MAKDVVACLRQARFGGFNLEAYRGIKPSEHIFQDEEKFKKIILLSEDLKMECNWTYKVEDTIVWNKAAVIWNLSQPKENTYVDDYKLLMNTLNKKNILDG